MTKGSTKIEVAYDKTREAWVVRPFYPRRGVRPRIVLAVYDEALDGKTARDRAIWTGRKLGRVLGRPDWPCELFIRRLDGTIGPRETYGRDPERTRG